MALDKKLTQTPAPAPRSATPARPGTVLPQTKPATIPVNRSSSIPTGISAGLSAGVPAGVPLTSAKSGRLPAQRPNAPAPQAKPLSPAPPVRKQGSTRIASVSVMVTPPRNDRPANGASSIRAPANSPLHHQLSSTDGDVPQEFRGLVRSSPSARATPARGIVLPDLVAGTPLNRNTLNSVLAHPPSASSSKIGWTCQSCRARVDPKSLVENQAIMRDGLPLCSRCLSKERAQRTRKVVTLAAVVSLTLGSAACLFFLRKTVSAPPPDSRTLKEAQLAAKIAETGNMAEADRRIKALTAKLGAMKAPEADVEILAGKAEKALRDRIKSEFGDISPKEEEVLMFVEGAYATAEVQHPVRALHVDDSNDGSITVLLPRPPVNNRVDGGMRSLPEDILRRFPKLASIKIHFACDSTGAVNVVGETYMDRMGLASMTRMAEQPLKIDPPKSAPSRVEQ